MSNRRSPQPEIADAALPAAFLAALARLPRGYSSGRFGGRRYGATVSESTDGRRIKLFAEELGGTDILSFNLFRLADGEVCLKPCEMPAGKVIRFVLGFIPDPGAD